MGIRDRILNHTSTAPLAVFRIIFGAVMLFSVLRFVLNGWVQTQYIDPVFHFSYYGFEWVKPLGALGMYTLFALMALSALFMMLGLFYRYASVLFFLTFTYVELIDKTNYLNHYYFISVVSCMLIFIPAHRYFSLDSIRKPNTQLKEIPYFYILSLQLILSIVYFHAGAAKLNSAWLFDAMPLKMWLPINNHWPIIGPLFEKEWVAYGFSWMGALYDLLIPIFLFLAATRKYAYLAVIVFHILTWLLFPIGMFPFIMIGLTLIFFPADFHHRILSAIGVALKKIFGKMEGKISKVNTQYSSGLGVSALILAIILFIQVIMPWRYLLYPGDLFWTEEGYRFSWRVMLMEKAGYVIFKLKDPQTGRSWEAYGSDYLTPMQEKQMSTQPDMIMQYAQFLEQQHVAQGGNDLEIMAEAYVTLNGQRSKLLIDPSIDLTKVQDGLTHKNWILSYQ